MSTRLLPAVAHLLTLVLACLLPVACRQLPAAKPTAGVPAPTPRPNLLRNPGFHEGTAMWDAAPGVEPAPLAIDPAGFAVVAAPGPGKSVAWSQSVPVQAGAAYYVACRVHSEGLAGCAWLGIGFRDVAGRLLHEARLPLATGDTDWAPWAWRCRAPTGAVQARVSFGIDGATAGRAAFDDLCFAPDDAPLTRALIVDWREEAGQLTAPAGPATVAGLAAALAWAEAGRSPCPAAAPPAASDTPVPSPAGQVLAGLRDTPRRLSAQGGDELGFTLLAGRSDDGCLAQVLIADAGSRSEAYRLALAGFPPGFHYTVTELVDGQPPTVVREGDGDCLADGVLMAPWRSPALHVIRIWWPGPPQ